MTSKKLKSEATGVFIGAITILAGAMMVKYISPKIERVGSKLLGTGA